MDKYKVIGDLYRKVMKPMLFAIDPEVVHEAFVRIGEGVENGEWIVENLFAYKNPKLNKKVMGVEFPNPIGLSAGFDYDGHLAKVMKHVGFGFNTVGTVTAKAYGGNARPMLGRLPKSKSLLVNKGFKSEGAKQVRERLDIKELDGHVIGISVGSSNIPEVNTINKAIDDYLFTFDVFKNRKYVKYFELNISCPNTAMPETFGDIKNFKKLAGAVAKLHIKQPIYVKMANEIDLAYSQEFIVHSLKNNIRGFVFSNLVKDRNNPAFDKEEMETVKNLKGNFSGKPTEDNANRLIKNSRKKFGKEIAIIGCGGVFSALDAQKKFDAGADLVQLITGMIYEGPQLIGEINKHLAIEDGE